MLEAGTALAFGRCWREETTSKEKRAAKNEAEPSGVRGEVEAAGSVLPPAKSEAEHLAIEAEKKRQEEAAAKNEAQRQALETEKKTARWKRRQSREVANCLALAVRRECETAGKKRQRQE